MFVLGIDPGLSRCGYGLIKIGKPKEKAVSAGVIRTSPNEVTSVRLFEIRNEIRTLISEYRPEVVAIERVLFQRNVKTAVSVSQVIGVIMVEALDADCEVAEYSPTEVKLAVAGYGGAQKAEIQTMVQLLLGIEKKLDPVDAADALAVASVLLGKSFNGGPMTIGSLRGEITVKEDNEMIIEVNGVGYRLQVTTSTYETSNIGQSETQFYIHHHFRENEQTLYGFLSRFECKLFEALISAHKVGPALGLSILSTYGPDQLIDIVNSQDIDALCLVPGVGKTTASRLLIDLETKFKKLSIGSEHLPSKANGTINDDIKDVRDALSGLGYGSEEIYAVTKDLPSETETSELIKLALQKLAKNSR